MRIAVPTRGLQLGDDELPAGVGFGQRHGSSVFDENFSRRKAFPGFGKQSLDAGGHTDTCFLRTFIKNGLSWDAYASRVKKTREMTTSSRCSEFKTLLLTNHLFDRTLTECGMAGAGHRCLLIPLGIGWGVNEVTAGRT